MKALLKHVTDHLIRIGELDLSSPSRSGYYQPDTRKLKEALNAAVKTTGVVTIDVSEYKQHENT